MTIRIARRAMPPPASASKRNRAPCARRRLAIVIVAAYPCITCVKVRFCFKKFSACQNIPHDFEAEPKSASAFKTAPQQKGALALKALPDFSNPQYLASAGEAEITTAYANSGTVSAQQG
ncbi:MAG: hypothetical protein LBI48_00885 [Burkholderiaceae bacterium]|jgi:hypothetical protein|nr:hypothetical protein [Burkholderiaceae bacterium]